MARPAATKGDRIFAIDFHITMVQAGPATVPMPLPYVFLGPLSEKLSPKVNGKGKGRVEINGKPAAVVGSVGHHSPKHIPMGGTFQKQPSNKGHVAQGSRSVTINGKKAARLGDRCVTCNDPKDRQAGVLIAFSNVLIGG